MYTNRRNFIDTSRSNSPFIDRGQNKLNSNYQPLKSQRETQKEYSIIAAPKFVPTKATQKWKQYDQHMQNRNLEILGDLTNQKSNLQSSKVNLDNTLERIRLMKQDIRRKTGFYGNVLNSYADTAIVKSRQASRGFGRYGQQTLVQQNVLTQTYGQQNFDDDMQKQRFAFNKSYDYSTNLNVRPHEQLDLSQSKVSYAIFEIYGSGYVYASTQGYKNSIGVGFMISQTLALTANYVLPSEEAALCCYGEFLNPTRTRLKFNPSVLYGTSKSYGFTIIAVKTEEQLFKPIDIRIEFRLKPNDIVTFQLWNIGSKTIQSIDTAFFTYTSGGFIPSGTPIFNQLGQIQGMHFASTQQYKFNQALRIDMIRLQLYKMNPSLMHQELDAILEEKYEDVALTLNPPEKNIEQPYNFQSALHSKARDIFHKIRFLY